MDQVKRGDRVVLIRNETPPSLKIPAWHSKFACVGTATTNGVGTAIIAWDNGHTAPFRVFKLELHTFVGDVNDPNFAFLLKKQGDKYG